jgi:NADH-quinone oxidoreductase subunit H
VVADARAGFGVGQLEEWAVNIGFEIVHLVVTILFFLLLVMTNAVIMVYAERKVMAYMQDRRGPMHYGPFGSLQSTLDVLKLLLKEIVQTKETDNAVFTLAPMIFFAPVITAFVMLPFSPFMTTSALGTGVILYVALSSLDVIGVFMAGWGSNSKYALIGGLRSAAQMISYELPLVLSLVGVIMLTSVLAHNGVGSISFSDIIASQQRPWWLWFILIQPLGLLIYYTCGLAETNRAPFDLPEAESELVAGYLTEYSGMQWAMFFLGEYGNMLIVTSVATALFLGGWSGPGADLAFWHAHVSANPGGIFSVADLIFNLIGVFWFLVKVYALQSVFIWIRSTLPRLRADQLMQFAWLILIPVTLFNILITAVLLLAVPQPYTLWVTGGVNWLMVIGYIVLLGRVIGASPKGVLPPWVQARKRMEAAGRAGPALPKPGATRPALPSTAAVESESVAAR